MLGAIVAPENDTQAPELRIFLLPDSEYTIIDTWHTAGLKGTGSKDVEVADTFVAEDMTPGRLRSMAGGETPGSAINPGPIFRLPVFAPLSVRAFRMCIGQRAGVPR